MKTNLIIFLILIFFIINISVSSQEVEFEASKIDISNNGKTIYAFDSTAEIATENIDIKSKKAKYSKQNEKIVFEKDVLVNDKDNNIIIKGDKIIYDKKRNIIYSESETDFNIENKYFVKSKNVYFDRDKKIIYSNDKTNIKDETNNTYRLNNYFEIDIVKKVINSNDAEIIDTNQNIYYFEKLIINLNTKEIAGKEIKINFEKSYFGNKDNDPILKGRSAISNEKELNLYKAVFSTCNTDNKECRGWELNTQQFKHDKQKKIFEYKDSWLKIFDFKVFYLPYFNHPDPTVKRKTGFLTPYYSSSDSLGTSINLPYFKVVDIDRDLTLSPRYYADKSFLLQNEYRQALKNANILSDFSFLVGDTGTKAHFFYNQIGYLKENLNYEINLQNVKGDNYLINHDLSNNSKLIKSNSLLLSNFDLNWSSDEASLNTSFKVFEDLSRGYHDRYQFIFPEFNFSKNIKIPENYFGNFIFNSYGHNKHYDTNINESVITNDFLFNSNKYINSFGLVSDYDLLLKNSNNYSENSDNFEENTNYNLYGTFKAQASLPMKKSFTNHINYLKPIVSFRYSPNGNSDLSSKDVLLNYNSAFDLNRIGTSYEVESDESITLGLEFMRNDLTDKNILDFKIANVIKNKENYYLPAKSKLNKTRSDIFGELNYKFNENSKIGYSFSYDKDLEYSNLEQINLEFGLNNFFTDFSYYIENNDIGNKENFKNKSYFTINKENKLSFEIAKNLKDDFTQYYDLIYEYQTDCISMNFKYNKSFFEDGNLKPNKSLSSLIKIIPFTELGVSNVESFIGN